MRRYLLFLVVYTVLFFFASAAWSKEPATPELTFQQAVEMAKAESEALASAQCDIDKSKQVRDYLQTKMLFAPTSPTTAEAEMWFTSYVQSDLNWQMAKRSYSAKEDTVVMKVYQAYNGVLQALENVKAAEAKLKSAEWNKKVAAVSKCVGLLDESGFKQAEAAFISAKTDLETAQKSLADAYQKFNLQVGLWPNDRPVLVDKPEFNKLSVDNLDVEVERALSASPMVWLLQKNVDLAKMNLDLYDLTNPNNIEPYSAKKLDIDKAEIAAKDSREQTRILVRTIYYNVINLEESYKKAQEGLKVAEENLRVVRLKYDVGMATNGDVLAAEADLAAARKSLFDVISQHEILAYAFKKPWAYIEALSDSYS